MGGRDGVSMDYMIDQDNTLKLKVFRICFYLTLISNLVIYIAQPLDISILNTLASRSFMLCNLVSFIFVINLSLRHYVPYKTHQIVIIVFMICFSFISYLFDSNCGLYDYIIRLWCYLALPFYFLYIDYLKPNKSMINFAFIVTFLVSINFILLSLSKYKYAGYEAFIGTHSAWLTLGYENPNQTAMYLLITIIILYCALSYYRNKLARILILSDIIYMAVLLFKTSSRTSIVIGVIVTVIILFKKKYYISKYIVIGILLLPAIFMFLYPYLYKNGWIFLFQFGGKTDYSSRSIIFLNVLLSLKNKFLFGAFGTYQLKNIHNGTLSVFSSLGLVGLVLFYIYYFRAYFNIFKNSIKSKTALISLIGLLAVFIHACTESAFIVGGSMYAGTLNVLIFLVKLDWKEVNRK